MSHTALLKDGTTIIIGREFVHDGVKYYDTTGGRIRKNKVKRILPNKNNVYSDELAKLRFQLSRKTSSRKRGKAKSRA